MKYLTSSPVENHVSESPIENRVPVSSAERHVSESPAQKRVSESPVEKHVSFSHIQECVITSPTAIDEPTIHLHSTGSKLSVSQESVSHLSLPANIVARLEAIVRGARTRAYLKCTAGKQLRQQLRDVREMLTHLNQDTVSSSSDRALANGLRNQIRKQLLDLQEMCLLPAPKDRRGKVLQKAAKSKSTISRTMNRSNKEKADAPTPKLSEPNAGSSDPRQNEEDVENQVPPLVGVVALPLPTSSPLTSTKGAKPIAIMDKLVASATQVQEEKSPAMLKIRKSADFSKGPGEEAQSVVHNESSSISSPISSIGHRTSCTFRPDSDIGQSTSVSDNGQSTSGCCHSPSSIDRPTSRSDNVNATSIRPFLKRRSAHVAPQIVDWSHVSSRVQSRVKHTDSCSGRGPYTSEQSSGTLGKGKPRNRNLPTHTHIRPRTANATVSDSRPVARSRRSVSLAESTPAADDIHKSQHADYDVLMEAGSAQHIEAVRKIALRESHRMSVATATAKVDTRWKRQDPSIPSRPRQDRSKPSSSGNSSKVVPKDTVQSSLPERASRLNERIKHLERRTNACRAASAVVAEQATELDSRVQNSVYALGSESDADEEVAQEEERLLEQELNYYDSLLAGRGRPCTAPSKSRQVFLPAPAMKQDAWAEVRWDARMALPREREGWDDFHNRGDRMDFGSAAVPVIGQTVAGLMESPSLGDQVWNEDEHHVHATVLRDQTESDTSDLYGGCLPAYLSPKNLGGSLPPHLAHLEAVARMQQDTSPRIRLPERRRLCESTGGSRMI